MEPQIMRPCYCARGSGKDAPHFRECHPRLRCNGAIAEARGAEFSDVIGLSFGVGALPSELHAGRLSHFPPLVGALDDRLQGQFYFAEWSPPPGVDVMDTRWWGWANPALGVTLDLESLLADAEHPDRSSFLRGSLNQFVNADACWLQPGEWEQCLSDIPGPEGGWIAVDTSIDGSRYSAVRAAVDDVGVAHITVEFVVGSLPEMQQALLKACENPSIMLAVTPPLENHVPLSLERRKKVVGYGELMRYTSLVKGMINDGRLVHQGQQNLAEQMNRAVAITQQNSLVISSKRSPGPVELARLTIFAAALASRPKQGGKPMLVVVNR